MGDNSSLNVEVVQQTLRCLKLLRSNVAFTFECLANGLQPFIKEQPDEDESDPSRYQMFLLEFEKRLKDLNVQWREFEIASTKLTSQHLAPLSGSNIGLLHVDCHLPDLCFEVTQMYKWVDKTRELGHATAILMSHSMKRSLVYPSSARKIRKTTIHIPPEILENAVSVIGRVFTNIQISVDKSFGTSSVLIVTLLSTLKAVIVLRSHAIEHVIVKAFSEDIRTEEGKIDIWSRSRYQVFQKKILVSQVTDHANAAMLHYCQPLNLPTSLKCFLKWLNSYSTLFSAPCRRCGNLLQEFLPPTWRDFYSLAAYHESCHFARFL